MVVSVFRNLIHVVRLLRKCIKPSGHTGEVARPRDHPVSQGDEDQIQVLALLIERAEARVTFQSQDIDTEVMP
jgi:hypothetical protein